jgi:hypothetical protein
MSRRGCDRARFRRSNCFNRAAKTEPFYIDTGGSKRLQLFKSLSEITLDRQYLFERRRENQSRLSSYQ